MTNIKNFLFLESFFGFKWCTQQDLNLRPHPSQGCALPAELWVQKTGKIWCTQQGSAPLRVGHPFQMLLCIAFEFFLWKKPPFSAHIYLREILLAWIYYMLIMVHSAGLEPATNGFEDRYSSN